MIIIIGDPNGYALDTPDAWWSKEFVRIFEKVYKGERYVSLSEEDAESLRAWLNARVRRDNA